MREEDQLDEALDEVFSTICELELMFEVDLALTIIATASCSAHGRGIDEDTIIEAVLAGVKAAKKRRRSIH